jgi:hypothetical protein
MHLSHVNLMSRVVRFLIPFLFGTSLGWFLLKVSRPILAIALRDTKLTCSGKSDGGGSQVLAIIGVAAFSEYFGARFVHTPLTYIEHCPKGKKMENFCADWESIVSLFGFSKTQGENFDEYSSLEDFLVDFLLFRTRGKLISLKNVSYITDTHPEVYLSIGLGAASRVKNKSGTKTIYVHVRRGDVTQVGPNRFRHTSDENVRRNIEVVLQQVTGDCEVYLVTEDASGEFREKFRDCTIVLEKDPVKALLLLARADILVMSKSAFSLVAALASTGEIFYEPCQSRPLPAWSILPT